MNEDKWYHDVQAKELINLEDCKAVWVHRDREESDEVVGQHTLHFAYYGKTKGMWLHYDSSKLLCSAFEHYKILLGCRDVDVNTDPITL